MSAILDKRYGYQVPSFRDSVIAGVTPGKFLNQEQSLPTRKDVADFIALWSQWAALEMAFLRMTKTLAESSEHDQETYIAIRKECTVAVMKFSEFKQALLLHDSYEEGWLQDWIAHEDYITWFSARVAIGTSLQVNSRLKQSLREVNDSPLSRLLEELPGAVRVELEDLVKEQDSPGALVRRVALQLEHQGSQSANLQRQGKLASDQTSELSADELMLEEFLVKEELRAVLDSAGLSEREYQVLELMLKDRTEGESAETLGLSTGSVKRLRYRVRTKLKEAAGL